MFKEAFEEMLKDINSGKDISVNVWDNLTDDQIIELSKTLKASNKVTSITFSAGTFTKKGIEAICDLIESNKSIKNYNFSMVDFGETKEEANKNAITIAKAIKNNNAVTEISFYKNGFNEETGNEVASIILKKASIAKAFVNPVKDEISNLLKNISVKLEINKIPTVRTKNEGSIIIGAKNISVFSGDLDNFYVYGPKRKPYKLNKKILKRITLVDAEFADKRSEQLLLSFLINNPSIDIGYINFPPSPLRSALDLVILSKKENILNISITNENCYLMIPILNKEYISHININDDFKPEEPHLSFFKSFLKSNYPNNNIKCANAKINDFIKSVNEEVEIETKNTQIKKIVDHVEEYGSLHASNLSKKPEVKWDKDTLVLILGSLNKSKKVQTVNLANTPISIDSCIVIANLIENNSYITSFYLSNTDLSGEDALKIVTPLEKNKTITTLFIDSNPRIGLFIPQIIQSLEKNSTITQINFAGCKLNTEGVKSISNFCQTKKGIIQHIALQDTDFPDPQSMEDFIKNTKGLYIIINNSKTNINNAYYDGIIYQAKLEKPQDLNDAMKLELQAEMKKFGPTNLMFIEFNNGSKQTTLAAITEPSENLNNSSSKISGPKINEKGTTIKK